MDKPPYDKPTFRPYSGPYSLLTEYLVRIVEHFEEAYYTGVLGTHGIGLGILVPKDENGVRELYKDPCYYFYELGKIPEPSPDSKYYSLNQVSKICKALQSGEFVSPYEPSNEPSDEQPDEPGGE